MPAVLDRCVDSVMEKHGYGKSRAYAICTTSTGWKRKKGGGWTKRKKGKSPLFDQSLKARE